MFTLSNATFQANSLVFSHMGKKKENSEEKYVLKNVQM